MIVKLPGMVDAAQLERRFAETLADLGLVGADGVLAADIDCRLSESAGGEDAYRAGLARYALDLMVMLEGANRSNGYEGESRNQGQA